MTRCIAMVLVAGLLVAAAPAPADEAKKDAEKLQGTWKLVSGQEDGRVPDGAKEFVIVFVKDTFTVKNGDDIIVKGTFKVDPSKRPKAIDMTIKEGRRKQDNGKVVHGIYELGKDSLKWCAAEPGSEDRPKEFATKEGTKHVLISFKKEKP